MPPESLNREHWLSRAVEELRPMFSEAQLLLIDKIHVSVGFPSRGATSAKNRTLGQCWSGMQSADEAPQIFISPVLADSSRVLDVLIHEMIHVSVGTKAGHGAPFKRAMGPLGLEGKPTATVASPWLKEKLDRMVRDALGIYPHPELTVLGKDKKQGTRLLKAECPSCGYTVRVTAKWIEVGMPTCPCGDQLDLSV